MVGGFSSSQLLKDMIKKTYGKYQVVIPKFPGECIVKGALIFGKNPNLIDTRIMRRTYGIGGYAPYDSSKHKKTKKRKIKVMEVHYVKICLIFGFEQEMK